MGKIAQSVTKSNISVGPRKIKLIQAAFGPAWVVYRREEPMAWFDKKQKAMKLAKYLEIREAARKAELPTKVVKVFYDAAESDDE